MGTGAMSPVSGTPVIPLTVDSAPKLPKDDTNPEEHSLWNYERSMRPVGLFAPKQLDIMGRTALVSAAPKAAQELSPTQLVLLGTMVGIGVVEAAVWIGFLAMGVSDVVVGLQQTAAEMVFGPVKQYQNTITNPHNVPDQM